MEHSEITLNGTDWNNLHLVDYPGGAGGEMFCEMLAEQYSPKVFWKKEHRNTVIDSVYNMFTTSGLPDFMYTFCGNGDDLEMTLKTAIVFSETVNKSGRNWDGNLKYGFPGHLINNMLGLIDDYSVYAERIIQTKIDSNVIIRTHDDHRDYELLKNANVYRLYPTSEEAYNIIFFRIGMLKFLEVLPDGTMQWELENKDKEINAKTFEEFVESNFEHWPGIIHENTIDALDWLTKPSDDNNMISKWKESNRQFFISNDIDICNPPSLEILKHKLYKQYRKNVHS